MIRINQNQEVYEISFSYDPVLVSMIKNVPGKRWNPSAKMWTIPQDKLGWFLNELKGSRYESEVLMMSNEHINENQKIDVTTDIPNIDISGVPFYVKEGAKPFQHQLDFMKFAINRQLKGNMNGFILADEMGCAKTCELMNLAIYNKKQYGYKHCLVICCINTSKYNWVEDVTQHTRGQFKPYILGTRFKRDKIHTRSDTGTKEKLEDLITGHMYGDTHQPELPYFLIMNIEGLRARSGKQYPIVDEICSWIRDCKINMIAIDEIHKNASPSSTQGKQLLKIQKFAANSVMWIPITGTPIVNKPTDVFTPLMLINGHNYSSYYLWCKQFCIYGGYGDHEIVGYKNIPRLKAMLQNNMIRRLKKDVLDLPPKIYYTEYVENTSYQQKLYDKLANDLISNRDNIVRALNPLAQFMRLRQINGSPEIVDKNLKIDNKYLTKNAKMRRAIEIINDAVERDEKIIVYSNWVEPLRTLYRFVSKLHKTCCYTGTMSTEDREKHKRVFQNNPEYKVMLGTVGAMGTGHTLTAANNVLFLDEPWTATDKYQAEDRTHRAGATKSINIYTLIAKDTIDERVHQIVYGKDQVSGYIVDNTLDIHNNPDLFDMLLGDTLKRRFA